MAERITNVRITADNRKRLNDYLRKLGDLRPTVQNVVNFALQKFLDAEITNNKGKTNGT